MEALSGGLEMGNALSPFSGYHAKLLKTRLDFNHAFG
jgi:hypothetical protein